MKAGDKVYAAVIGYTGAIEVECAVVEKVAEKLVYLRCWPGQAFDYKRTWPKSEPLCASQSEALYALKVRQEARVQAAVENLAKEERRRDLVANAIANLIAEQMKGAE